MNPHSPENEMGAPRTRETSPPSLLGLGPQGANDQLKEDVRSRGEESDSPILLRDGRADHTGKGRAENQRRHSTDARGRNAPKQSISRTLSALSHKAKKDEKYRFRSLYRLIDLQMLYHSFYALKPKAAPGVDGVTWRDYAANLDENLRSLLDRLKDKRYRAQSVKRRYIPKGNGRLRPLGIPTLEYKLVQHAASRILESIFEVDFYDSSVGYRRGKPGARECSLQLAHCLDSGTCRWVVEADIRSFFDEVDHDWLVRMLEQRIDDRAFIGLIRKWLQAGVLEPGTEDDPTRPERGTPQGGIISPILANIYLHYVLDHWIEKVVRRERRGEVIWMRYADDSVVGFEYRRDAEAYLRALPNRLGKFNLRLAEEKSSLVKFNRWEPDQSGKFTFLGFDFYWGRTRKNANHKMVRRRTNKEKFRKALQGMKAWIRKARSWPLKMIVSSLRSRLTGYWNYYGVQGNSHMTWKYYSAVKQLVFKWLNRRSQRKSFTWGRFHEQWRGRWQVPSPCVVEEAVRFGRGSEKSFLAKDGELF